MKNNQKGFVSIVVIAIATVMVVVGGGYLYINKDSFLKKSDDATQEALSEVADSNESLPSIVRQNNSAQNSATIKPKAKTGVNISASSSEVSATVKAEMQKAINDIGAFLATTDKTIIKQLSANIFLEGRKERLEKNLAILNSSDQKMKDQVKRLDPGLFSDFVIKKDLLDGVEDDLRRARIIADAAKEINFVPNNTDPIIQFMDLDEYRLEQMRQSHISKDLVSAKLNDSLIFFFDINKAALYRGSSVIKLINGFKDESLQ